MPKTRLQKKFRVISGIVQRGQGRGEEIGVRTANLNINLAGDLSPGLYTCVVFLEEKKYQGLLYYGINSLTNADCLEVHVLGFEGDLYGKLITVTIGRYLRLPKKFASVEALGKQVKKDLINANKKSLD